jgi:DNA (cytosine-5)-methyltransferase 1
VNDLTHIDLFSGIGGFALAAGWAGFRTVAMCEIDPFCQEVLKARFGAVADAGRKRQAGTREQTTGTTEQDDGPILIPDIRDFDGTRFRGATLLTGGFPCQPFSCAGKRRGKEDNRYLWPGLLRVITESHPRWIIAENVRGLISIEDGVVFEQVCADLESEEYEVQTFIIPACAVNAPHRRDRVWVIAHATEYGTRRGQGTVRESERRQDDGLLPRPVNADSDAPDATEPGLPHRRGPSLGEPRQEQEPQRCGGDLPTAEQWDIPWIEVATRFCRVDDGLPAWIHARRVARLKALGNAIVPQVAYEIIKVIAEIERGK